MRDNNKKGYKRKPDYKGRPAPKEVEEKLKANDPTWYIRNGQLAKDVASLSFNNAAGARVLLDEDNTGGDATLNSLYLSIPGIMAIHTMPYMGVSFGPTSPVNVAAKNLYTFVRHANSGHSNYDSPDLMLYIMAMDSVYAGIAHLQRVIGTANLFSQVNRYVGDALIEAMGFQPSLIRTNLANYRARVNMLILKASAFCVPNSMTLFKRHMWMYTTIFQDSPVAKCQFYLYRPDFLYKYVETAGGPGYLDPIMMSGAVTLNNVNEENWTPSAQTFELWASRVESLLNAMIESEDINIMSGDILKAYGRENLFRLEPISEEYTVVPFYSEEVLDQIHNTNFIGPFFRTGSNLADTDQMKKFNSGSFRYTQIVSVMGNYLITAPKFTHGVSLSYTKLLDMADNDPTPERVLVATRNMLHGVTSVTTVTDVPSITSLDCAASDLCIMGSIYYYTMNSGVWLLTRNTVYQGDGILQTVLPEKFIKAPIGYSINYNTATNAYAPTQPAFEIGNYTLLNREDISKLHESAILSMLGVPV